MLDKRMVHEAAVRETIRRLNALPTVARQRITQPDALYVLLMTCNARIAAGNKKHLPQ